jgi:hypothetical protein
MMFAPAALAQTDYDCPDFATQEEAQQFLLAGDPYLLDADNDGMACNNLAMGGTGSGMTQQPTTPTTPPTTTAPTTAPNITEMPATGGPSLLIPAGVLLASGLIGLGLMRRK